MHGPKTLVHPQPMAGPSRSTEGPVWTRAWLQAVVQRVVLGRLWVARPQLVSWPAQSISKAGKSRGPHIELKRVPAPRSYGTAWPCHSGGGYKVSGPARPDSAEVVPGGCEAGLPQHTAGHRPGLHWGLKVPV